MIEQLPPRLSNGRLDPSAVSILQDVAAEFQDDNLDAVKELQILAPDERRPDFQQDVLHPLLLIGINDLQRKLHVMAEDNHNLLAGALSAGSASEQLIRTGFLIGSLLSSSADFQSSFMLEPEQAVRLARYTSHGSDPTLYSFQNDTITSHFNMSSVFALGMVYRALEEGSLADLPDNIDFYAELLNQRWFKKITHGAMNTGNGFWAGPTPVPYTVKDEGWEQVMFEASQTSSYWEVKGPLPVGPVSISPVLHVLLAKRVTDQNAGQADGLLHNEYLPTGGCPIRHRTAKYSTDPADINYLTPGQLQRLTEEENPLVTIDTSDPSVLHVQYSIENFLTGRFISALDGIATTSRRRTR